MATNSSLPIIAKRPSERKLIASLLSDWDHPTLAEFTLCLDHLESPGRCGETENVFINQLTRSSHSNEVSFMGVTTCEDAAEPGGLRTGYLCAGTIDLDGKRGATGVFMDMSPSYYTFPETQLPSILLRRAHKEASELSRIITGNSLLGDEIAGRVIWTIGRGASRWGHACPHCRQLVTKSQTGTGYCTDHGTIESPVLLMSFPLPV